MRNTKTKLLIVGAGTALALAVWGLFGLVSPGMIGSPHGGLLRHPAELPFRIPGANERGGAYETDPIILGETGDIVGKARAGEVDLLAELRRLRMLCGVESDSAACNDGIMEKLLALPEPDASKLAALFRV